MQSREVLAVVGPTAVGKSAVAHAVAEHVGAEVVSTDAFAVYRGMDIGTAKPTPAERARVPHHCIDVVEIDHRVTVAEFQRLARAAIDSCLSRGVPVVLTGGSALYVRAVLDPFDFPGTDDVIRSRLLEELERVGPAAMHLRLAHVDPAAAAEILPSNGRRVVRALEVIEMTGRPFQARLQPMESVYPGALLAGLRRPTDVLDARIAARVAAMWDAGFVAEVERLAAAGLAETPTACRAVGYAQVLQMLKGAISEDEARAETVRATRRLARRQMSWWRRDSRIEWLGADPDAWVEHALTRAGWLGGEDVVAAPRPTDAG